MEQITPSTEVKQRLNCPKITGVETLEPACDGSATVCHSVRETPAQYLRKEMGVKPLPHPRQFKH
jgi:hypothetical protein